MQIALSFCSRGREREVCAIHLYLHSAGWHSIECQSQVRIVSSMCDTFTWTECFFFIFQKKNPNETQTKTQHTIGLWLRVNRNTIHKDAEYENKTNRNKNKHRFACIMKYLEFNNNQHLSVLVKQQFGRSKWWWYWWWLWCIQMLFEIFFPTISVWINFEQWKKK